MLERFRAFGEAGGLADPSPFSPEFEGALLVNQVVDEQVSLDTVRSTMTHLLTDLEDDATPWQALADYGYNGDQDHYTERYNSALDQVLVRRTGIPISLGVLLIEVARRRGYAASGINHPGHFLVRVDEDLIDPFTMQPVLLDTADRARAKTLPAISPVEFVLRMLNNLKYTHSREQAWDQALCMVDYQLALVPNHPQLLCEKGEFWSQLGASGAAADAYRQALTMAAGAPPDLTAKLQQRLAQLSANTTEVVH
ncbi:MAG: tetratricopeptide repeat protein [Pseudomonadales bacterium]